MTSLTGESVRIYPMPVWQGVEAKLAKMPLDASLPSPLPRPRELLRPGRRVRRPGSRPHPWAPARVGLDERRGGRPGPGPTTSKCGTTSGSSASSPANRSATTMHAHWRSSEFEACGPRPEARGPWMSPFMCRSCSARCSARSSRSAAGCSSTARSGSAATRSALLDAGATRVIGLDRDARRLPSRPRALATFGERVEFVHADYRQLPAVLDGRGVERCRACSRTSACRRCSSTPRAAGSVSGATSRSTCGWTRARGPTAADW